MMGESPAQGEHVCPSERGPTTRRSRCRPRSSGGTDHSTRRGWTVAATFKDGGYSGFKEITRDGFGELIAAIEAGRVDVVIVRDIDQLTRNLTDWNAFEKTCLRHGVRLSANTGRDLDLSTPEGAYYDGMETLRAKREAR